MHYDLKKKTLISKKLGLLLDLTVKVNNLSPGHLRLLSYCVPSLIFSLLITISLTFLGFSMLPTFTTQTNVQL